MKSLLKYARETFKKALGTAFSDYKNPKDTSKFNVYQPNPEYQDKIANAMTYVSQRFLGAEDAFFYVVAYNNQLVHLSEYAAKNLLKGAITGKELYELAFTPEKEVANVETTREESQAWELIRNTAKAIKIQAEMEARRLTFNNDPIGLLGLASKGISKFLFETGHVVDNRAAEFALRNIVPFTRIVANVFNAGFDYTPVGIIRALSFYKKDSPMLYGYKEKTAFEVGVNLQPVQDKLDVYSSCLEVIEKHITDLLGQAYYKNVYKGCKVNRGRQYIIYSADDLMKKYNNTRKAGANVTALNDLLEKYYEALFRNDSTSLEISKKLIYVEPFVHNTIDEVGKWQLSNDEYLKKVFYQEWLSTMNNTDLYSLSVEKLKVKLSDYVKQKSLKDETKDLQ